MIATILISVTLILIVLTIFFYFKHVEDTTIHLASLVEDKLLITFKSGRTVIVVQRKFNWYYYPSMRRVGIMLDLNLIQIVMPFINEHNKIYVNE